MRRRKRGANRGIHALLTLGLLSSGCFAYDSRWGQREEEQKHAAARLRPKRLEHGPGQGPDATLRAARVRAYATRAYAAETLDWERRFDTLLRDATAVLQPELGVTLENGGTTLWEPQAPEDRLDQIIDELIATDAGSDADWVVAFVQSTPKLVVDFHALGVARYYAKHLVVRASNDPRELEIITQGLDEIDEKKRHQLYAQRRHHRFVTTFLHEIGHTLGAIHRKDRASILSPIYHPEERGFDADTLGLMRLGLPSHFDGASHPLAYDSIARYLEAHPDGWIDADRAERQEWLRAAEAPRSAPSTEPAAPAPAPAEPASAQTLASMPPDARRQLDHAVQTEFRGDIAAAWNEAAPLFEAFPNVLEVQGLRCRLAKAKRFYALVVDAHCERFEALGGKRE